MMEVSIIVTFAIYNRLAFKKKLFISPDKWFKPVNKRYTGFAEYLDQQVLNVINKRRIQ